MDFSNPGSVRDYIVPKLLCCGSTSAYPLLGFSWLYVSLRPRTSKMSALFSSDDNLIGLPPSNSLSIKSVLLV